MNYLLARLGGKRSTLKAQVYFLSFLMVTTAALLPRLAQAGGVYVNLPAPTILAPGPDPHVTNAPLIVRGLTRNLTQVDVYIDNELKGRAKVVDHPSGTASFAYQIPALSVGQHRIATQALSEYEIYKSPESVVTFNVVQPLPAPTLLKLQSNANNWQKPQLSGLTKNDTAVEVFIDGRLNGIASPANHPSGTTGFVYESFLNLENGWHSFSARAVAANGKKSILTDSWLIIVGQTDTASAPSLSGHPAEYKPGGPVAPTLVFPASGTVTNKAKPIIGGLALNQQLIQVFIDDHLVGQIKTDTHTSGVTDFSYEPFINLAPGVHSIYARPVSNQGDIGGKSNTLTILVRPKTNPIVIATGQTSSQTTPAAPSPDALTSQAAGTSTKETITEPEARPESTLEVEPFLTTTVGPATTTTDTETGPGPAWLIIIGSTILIVIIGIISWFTTKPRESSATIAFKTKAKNEPYTNPAKVRGGSAPSDTQSDLPPPPPPL